MTVIRIGFFILKFINISPIHTNSLRFLYLHMMNARGECTFHGVSSPEWN